MSNLTNATDGGDGGDAVTAYVLTIYDKTSLGIGSIFCFIVFYLTISYLRDEMMNNEFLGHSPIVQYFLKNWIKMRSVVSRDDEPQKQQVPGGAAGQPRSSRNEQQRSSQFQQKEISKLAKKKDARTRRMHLMFFGRLLVLLFSGLYLLLIQISWKDISKEALCSFLNDSQGTTYYLSRMFGYVFLILRLQLVATDMQSKNFQRWVPVMSVVSLVAVLAGLCQTYLESPDVSSGYCDSISSKKSQNSLLIFVILDIFINLVLLVLFFLPLHDLIKNINKQLKNGGPVKGAHQRKSELLDVMKRNALSCLFSLSVSVAANLVYWSLSVEQDDVIYERLYNAANILTSFDIIIHCLATLYTHRRFRFVLFWGWFCGDSIRAERDKEDDLSNSSSGGGNGGVIKSNKSPKVKSATTKKDNSNIPDDEEPSLTGKSNVTMGAPGCREVSSVDSLQQPMPPSMRDSTSSKVPARPSARIDEDGEEEDQTARRATISPDVPEEDYNNMSSMARAMQTRPSGSPRSISGDPDADF